MKKLTIFLGIILVLFLCYDFTLSQQPLIKPIFAKITDLADVNVSSHTDGYALVWDSTTSKYLEAAAVPSGSVDVSGTPVDNDYAKWTDANTIEGRSYAETAADLEAEIESAIDTLTDVVVDKLEVNESFTFDAVQTATGDGTTTIDWGLGNIFYFTFGAQNDAFTFTAPPGSAPLYLFVKQDGVGSRTINWAGVTVLWPGNVEPVLSTTAAYVDIITFIYDGTSYHGIANYDFR